MICTFLFERLYFDQHFDQNSHLNVVPRLYFDQNSPLGRSRRSHHLACGRFGSGWWCPRRPGSCAAMPALPSPRRDLRRHLLLIHSVKMHLISIKVLIEMYFILIEILKNALFLQPLYFESNFEKCTEYPRQRRLLERGNKRENSWQNQQRLAVGGARTLCSKANMDPRIFPLVKVACAVARHGSRFLLHDAHRTPLAYGRPASHAGGEDASKALRQHCRLAWHSEVSTCQNGQGGQLAAGGTTRPLRLFQIDLS